MRTAIFDLETFSLSADTGILLCAAIREYRSKQPPTVIRADSYPEWKSDRTNVKPMVLAVVDALKEYDIFVAHNGQYFDKPMLISWCVKFHCSTKLRFAKFIDPVLLARRHMKLTRNSLSALLAFLDIPEKKTSIEWKHWMQAAFNGDRKSMDYIVEHCVVDVNLLEKAYERTKKLVNNIDNRGSSF